MTSFDRAMVLCGLSTRAGADMFGCDFNQVVAWRLGREEVPEDAWSMLADLHAAMEEAASLATTAFGERDINPMDYDQGITVELEGESLPSGVQHTAGTLAMLRHLHADRQAGRRWWHRVFSREEA